MITIEKKLLNKIVCVGKNYADHVNEMGGIKPKEPIFFLKHQECLSRELHSQHAGDSLHYELEFCVRILRDDAGHIGIQSFGLAIDLTKRDKQKRLKNAGLPWEVCKAFSGSLYLTEQVLLSELSDPLSIEEKLHDLEFFLAIDDVLTQHGKLSDMIFGLRRLIEDADRHFSLQTNDLLLTGTPAGVGVIRQGSQFTCTLKSCQKIYIEHMVHAQ